MEKKIKQIIDNASDTVIDSLSVLGKAESLDKDMRISLYQQFVSESMKLDKRPALQALLLIIQARAGKPVVYLDDAGEWRPVINEHTQEVITFADPAEWLASPRDYAYIWQAGKYAESVKLFRALFRESAL